MSAAIESGQRAAEGGGDGDAYPTRTAPDPLVAPRVDPVIWSPAWRPGPLEEAQREHYARNGFLVLPEVFTGDKLERLRALTPDALLECGVEADTVIREPDSESVRSVFEIHRQHELVGSLVRDTRLLDVARYLLGGDVYIHQSRINFKPGFDGREFYWHSDFETWHAEDGMPRMRAVSMSVLLTDNEAHNGPLLFIKRSHDFFVACVGETPDDHYKHSLRKQEYGVPDRDSMTALAERGGVTAVVAPAGSVVVFDCNLLHGSPGNLSPYPRSNLFFVYNSVENRCVAPYAGTKPRPQHVANRRYLEAL